MLGRSILLFLAVWRIEGSETRRACDDETCPGASTNANSMIQIAKGRTKKAKVPLMNPGKPLGAHGPASFLNIDGELHAPPTHGCNGGPGCIQIDLVTDNYPAETKWKIVNMGTGSVEMEGWYDPHDQSKSRKFTYSKPVASAFGYKVVLEDTYGDGMCCEFGSGEFVVHYEGHEVMRVTKFTSVVEEQFNSGEGKIEIKFITDDYPDENTVEIHDACQQGVKIFERTFSDRRKEHDIELVVHPGEYEVVIKDAYGDGICCSNGNGKYEIRYDGQLVGSGGHGRRAQFTYSKHIGFGKCPLPSE